MFRAIADAVKAVLGLSGAAYLAGFVLVNASFLSRGVGEANLLDAKYVAAGALFLFVGIPVTIFPYVRILASLNTGFKSVTGSFVSAEFNTFYDNNKGFLTRVVGPFLVFTLVVLLLPELTSKKWKGNDVLRFITASTVWYVSSYILSRLAAIVFNTRFYWRVNMIRGGSVFWENFKNSFIRRFKASFESSYELTNGKKPAQEEVEAALQRYVGEGVGPEGFLGSALYKGIALFVLNAVTFGWFLYPLVPASIGGGKNQTVVLLLSAEKSAGLVELGLTGKQIKVEGKDTKGPGFQLMTAPMPLLAKTSEAYFVLVTTESGMRVVKIPLSSVEGVSYGGTER